MNAWMKSHPKTGESLGWVIIAGFAAFSFWLVFIR